ncbi:MULTISPECIES: hypothetical protein [Shewanella]|jgi:endo-1,4-beta-xylanase|uniref:hypothetical protein n=1 Tax=Shewanella TaxID=22 RepID=UPI00200F9A89|nr:hypothetical protein [Shewanella basaltis]MCL1112811.1 hypothetical protein [Shewanella basaltis]
MITELDIDVLPFIKEGQVFGQAFMHSQFQLEEFEPTLTRKKKRVYLLVYNKS